MKRTIKRALGTGALVAAIAAAAPAGAGAATANVVGGALQFAGAPTEANHLTLGFDWFHMSYTAQDSGVASVTTATGRGATCSNSNAQTVSCPFGSFGSVVVHLGNGGSYAKDDLNATAVTMYAGSGNDTLVGGGATTTLVGGAGTDTLTAGGGDTTLTAGSGPATMTGGRGHDTFQGGPAADTINSRDGVAEQVSCGGGVDTVVADTTDVVAADCEHVDRGVAAPVSGGSGSSLPVAGNVPSGVAAKLPVATVAPTPAKLATTGVLSLQVSCPVAAVAGCDGQLTVALPGRGAAKGKVVAARREKRVLGKSRRFRIAAGQTLAVPVKLSRRGARILSTRGGGSRRVLKVEATVAMRTEAGVQTATRTVQVHAARRRVMRAQPKRRR